MKPLSREKTSGNPVKENITSGNLADDKIVHSDITAAEDTNLEPKKTGSQVQPVYSVVRKPLSKQKTSGNPVSKDITPRTFSSDNVVHSEIITEEVAKNTNEDLDGDVYATIRKS